MRRPDRDLGTAAAGRPAPLLAWVPLGIAACFIAPAALFVHDYMLTWLHVPYPTTSGLPAWVSAIGLFVRLAAVAGFCQVAAPSLTARAALRGACAATALMLMLQETLRLIVIEHVIVDSWTYALLDTAPNFIALGMEVLIVAFAALRGLRWPALLAIIGLVSVSGAMVITPLLTTHFAHWRDALSGPVTEHYTDPYPPRIMVIIYVTFIEPTLAAIVLAALCWQRLRGKLPARILGFTILLLLIRGRFTSVLLNSFWVQQARPVAFLAEAQFFLETMVLGLLVATAWASLRPRNTIGF